jgi:hypothetical protein
MSVTEQTPRNVSTAAAGATIFPYGFVVASKADLLVKVDGATKTVDVDYTVSGVGVDSGGDVTFVTPLAGGERVERARDMPLQRLTDYQNLGDLRAETLNRDIDATVMMIQQLDGRIDEEASRSLQIPLDSTANARLPALVPLAPIVVNADASGFDMGSTSLTGDMLLRSDLASSVMSKGAGLVFPAIEALGAKGDGVTLDDVAFANAAALGRTIKLRAGATYYLSQRLEPANGSRFVCDGLCEIKLKTGAGGWNNVALNGDVKSANSVFLFVGVDGIGVSGVEFTTDGVKEVAIWPIRVIGGCTARGCDFERVRFNGLSLLSGGYLSLNSIGDGGYRVHDIEARDCGTAQGPTYWTGTPQITVFEIDNDISPGAHSKPGYATNIRGINVLLSGAALAAWGQQTDVVNIAGISGADRKGPTIHGVYADGIGEVLDLFCTGACITGVRARNAHLFVAKFAHGAKFNHIEIDHVESCGLAVVTFAGSSALASHTEYNTCRVYSATGIGDAGDGPSSSDVSGVLFQENGGSLATCLPRNNTCEIVNFVGGINTDYAIKDNCSVDNANNNLVRFDRLPTGMTAFGTIAHNGNVRAEVRDRARVEACLTGNQTPLSSGVDTTVAFSEAVTDRHGQLNTGTYKVRLNAPGVYRVKASVRAAGNAGDDVAIKALKNATVICQTASEPSSGSLAYTYTIDKVFEITPAEAGTAAADISIVANVTSAGTITLIDTNSMTFFEVSPVP